MLIDHPYLIEEGCTFLQSEINLNGMRCDLLFMDWNNRQLYVEVKLKVDDRAVGQLIRYAGLVSNPDARFMLVGLSIVAGLKEGIVKHGYEYKEINLSGENINHEVIDKKIYRKPFKYETPEQILQTFNSYEREMALAIFDYADSLDGTFFSLSDGIMIRRSGRNYKFVSITTKGNRVLFHLPIKIRDSLYEQFKDKEKIFKAIDRRNKNQIDIKLKDIISLEVIKEIIDIAYAERE